MDYHSKCDILMNAASYKSKNSIIRLIKNIDNLKQLAIMGNAVAASIVIDLEDALANSKITSQQRKCIELIYIMGYSYEDVCQIFNYKSDYSITQYLNGGIKNIMKYLDD